MRPGLFTYYNFSRIHEGLRVTHAMEAGIADHVWTLAEIAGLVKENPPKKRGPYKKKNSTGLRGNPRRSWRGGVAPPRSGDADAPPSGSFPIGRGFP